MKSTKPASAMRGLRFGAVLLGVSLSLGACTHTSDEVPVTSSIPNDYRQRHPIAITEADRTVVIFVGNARGGLNAAQRSDVVALAQTWLREGTGAIIAEVPEQTLNARAAADSMREIHALLTANGVPPRGITLRKYHPVDDRQFAAIRLIYPKIAAVAGPCGTWPDDLGPSAKNKGYYDNKPYWNLGCANQRNLAAMVDNPSDLVQPRPETPAYTARRSTIFETYRTAKPETDKTAAISEVGK
jgi:pilus assembly protein CpaD